MSSAGHAARSPVSPHQLGEPQPVDAFERDALACLNDVARFAQSLSRAPDEADDLVQETYLRALRGRHTFREGADMRRWLFTICKNVFLRVNERAKEQVSLSDDPTDETLTAVRAHVAMHNAGETILFDRLSGSDAIAKALNTLAEPYRLVVVLVDVEGYGYDDAADVLGIPIGTVRSRLFRARRLLQEQLIVHARDAGFSVTRTPPQPSQMAPNSPPAPRTHA